MKKYFLKIIAFTLAAITTFSSMCGSAAALTWSGDTNGIGGNTTGVAENGFAIISASDNLAGYRFSVVDKNGNTRNGKVIDVFRSTEYGEHAYKLTYSTWGHKFKPKYNKVQWIENYKKGYSTGQTQDKTYMEGSNIYFFSNMPVTTSIKKWMNNSMNLNAVLSKLGITSVHELRGGDKVLVEPLFFIRINDNWHTMTVTEIGVFGLSKWGANSTGGNNYSAGHWGFIKKYSNRVFPNSLYEPTGADGLWRAASEISYYATFINLIKYGYGVGIAYAVDAAATYNVKYLPNGAPDGSTPSSTHEFGVSKALTANGFKWEHHVFKGWNTKANGSGTAFVNKQKVKDLTNEPGKTVKLYAQWEIDPVISIEAIEPNSKYREGVTVITSFRVYNESKDGEEFTPDSNVTVKFTVKKGSETLYSAKKKGVVIPAEKNNLVYFKWKVPSGLKGASVKVTAEVTLDDLKMDKTSMNVGTAVTANYQTPDTQYESRKPSDWSKPSVPSESNGSSSWSEWVYEDGTFKKKSYKISTSSTVTVTPDSGAPSGTASTIRSGYGFNVKWKPKVESTGSAVATSDMYTKAQTGYALFPEFEYARTSGKCRLLEANGSSFRFHTNSSAEGDRLHFTPLWYPNGTSNYTVSVYGYDVWTPMGMLTICDNSNSLSISGSLYDDYFIGRK